MRQSTARNLRYVMMNWHSVAENWDILENEVVQNLELSPPTVIWLPGGAAGVSSGVTGWYNGFITEIEN